MQLNREQRRAAHKTHAVLVRKTKRQRHHVDPRAGLRALDRARPFDPCDTVAQHILLREAMERLVDGTGNHDDFDLVAMALNLARVRAADIDAKLDAVFAKSEAALRARAAHELRRLHAQTQALIVENETLHAENETLRAGYDAARLEIESLKERVQQLGHLARDVNSRRVVELEAQLAAVGAGGVEPLRKRCLHQISEPAKAGWCDGCSPDNCGGRVNSAAPAQAVRAGWNACLRNLFSMTDQTGDEAAARETTEFMRGRVFEAKGVARAMNSFGPEHCDDLQAYFTPPAAPAQAGEYPPLVCDYCGALTPDPWHSSGMLHGKMSKHIHSCDACAARGAAQVQAMLAAAPRNATLYNPDDVAFPVQRCADGVDALPPELASIARPTSIAAVEVAAPSAPAREPLTNEQIDEIHLANSDAYERGDVEYEFYGFVRAIERHHGITAAQKGGKHGTE